MLLTKFVEVPNTNIKEEVLSDFGWDMCYDMAQQYGHAQLVWYALNGNRVVEGEYTDKDHICGVDFFGKGFELNPDLDFKLLDEYFSSFGYTKANPHPAGRYA